MRGAVGTHFINPPFARPAGQDRSVAFHRQRADVILRRGKEKLPLPFRIDAKEFSFDAGGDE